MPSLPSLRCAVFSDLHIGSDTSGGWHNRHLTDDPIATVRATVAAVNRARPDVALVLGDLAQNGAAEQLTAARAALDGLEVPWLACRGNHDLPYGGDGSDVDGTFGHALAGRTQTGVVTPDLLPLPEGVMALTLEARWRVDDGQWRVFIPDDELRNALDAAASAAPALLLACCHFPFVRQGDYIRSQDLGGKNAGTLWKGETALAALGERCGALICLAGHQHFHHITAGAKANWLHCTTAALVEYPAEYRIIETGPAGARVTTRLGAPAIVATAPAPAATWVAGRPKDRDIVWQPGGA